MTALLIANLVVSTLILLLLVVAGAWGWVRFHRWNKTKQQLRTVIAAASKRRT